MAGLSDFAESGVLSHFFRTDTLAKPTVIAIALCANVPVDSDTGALTSREIANAGSYARQTLNPLDANWTYTQTNDSGVVANASTVTFPTATADWGWVSGVAITTSATYGAGNYIVGGALALPKLISNGDAIHFSAADISLYLS